MDVKEIKKHIGKKVLIVLRNNFKYTIIIPRFEGSSFSVKDRYGENVTIECDMISLICGKEGNTKGD